MSKMKPLFIYTDGSCQVSTGNAAIAFTIYDDDGNIVSEDSKFIGRATNNIAEYKALIVALEEASKYSKNDIFCFSDSELLVKQLNGQDKVKAKHLKELFSEVIEKAKKFKRVTYAHRQEKEDPKIARVDRLAKAKMKSGSKLVR